MKKKILLRSLLGGFIGLSISYIITVLISLCIGDGRYYAVTPQLAAGLGGEMNAVLIQTIGSVIYGAAFGGGSVIWEIESWSLLKMTVTHLIIISVCCFPTAYFMQWIPHNVLGIAIYCAVFFGIYLGIWLAQYFAMKKKIQLLNNEISKNAHQSQLK